jgi:hypothetical protein
MRVHASYLNSIDIRDARLPYSSLHDGQRYVRKFLTGDTIRVQLVLSGYGSADDFIDNIDVAAGLLDCTGAPIQHDVQVVKNEQYADQYGILDIIISDVPTGEYSLSVRLFHQGIVRQILLQSEPFCVSEELNEQSVLIEVSNSTNYFGVFFEADVEVSFSVRVEGGFYPNSLNLESDDTIFEGQQAQLELLYSMPFETRRLLLGGARGIPDSFAQKLNRFFSCDTITVDGVPYTKASGAKFEAVSADRFPFRSWAINVQEQGDPFEYSSVNGWLYGLVDDDENLLVDGDNQFLAQL